MRKILIYAGIIAALLAQTVFAEGYSLSFVSEKFGEYGILGGYDKNGTLVYAEKLPIVSRDGQLQIDPGEETKKAAFLRLFMPQADTVVTELKTVAEKPADDSKDDPKDEPKDDSKEQISRYPTALDAATAFAVVKRAELTVVNEEEMIELDVFFRGTEQKIYADTSKTLASAPEEYRDLADAELTALKSGDVIYMTTNLSGGLSTVELIFRPQTKDYVTDGEEHGASFEKLFTTNGAVSTKRPTPYVPYGRGTGKDQQYAFGVICEKNGNQYMTLRNRAGREDQEIEVLLTQNTVVYLYDKTKKEKLTMGSSAEIEKSEIPSASLDEDGNIAKWDSDCVRNYALVRMDDGVALDVVVYMNYEG